MAGRANASLTDGAIDIKSSCSHAGFGGDVRGACTA